MDQHVCGCHVGDAYLRRFVEDLLEDLGEDAGDCDFCDDEARRGVPLQELVEVIEAALNSHFQRAADAGVPLDEGEWQWPTYDTSDAIGDLEAGNAVEDPLLQAILSCIEDDVWVPRGTPLRTAAERLRDGWREFSAHVQHTSRYLLRPDSPPSEFDWDPDYRPAEVLQAIGDVITDSFDLIRPIAQGTPVYRARTYSEYRPNKPEELVSPPTDKAGQGRMNAAGITVFYGALDPDTAAAEVYDGNDRAVIATMEPLRDLQVVDLTRIPDFSVFDPDVPMKDFDEAVFLRGFVADIVQPIIRDGRVHYEYAPTQYVTEYLRWQLGHGCLLIDGIVYPSARASGSNLVIFVTPTECLDDDQMPEGKKRPPGEAQLLRFAATTVEIRCYEPPRSRSLRTEPLGGHSW